MTIYDNAVQVYTGAYANTPDVVAASLDPATTIAGIGGGSVFSVDLTFSGQFDEVRIYNGALTPGQIGGGPIPPPSLSPWFPKHLRRSPSACC